MSSPSTASPSSTPSVEAEPPAPTTPTVAAKKKISVLLKPVGDAPGLKVKTFTVDEDRTVGFLLATLRQLLGLQQEESLYVFINQAFAPSIDHTIGNLHTCFAGAPDAKLVVNYGRTVAWG